MTNKLGIDIPKSFDHILERDLIELKRIADAYDLVIEANDDSITFYKNMDFTSDEQKEVLKLLNEVVNEKKTKVGISIRTFLSKYYSRTRGNT